MTAPYVVADSGNPRQQILGLLQAPQISAKRTTGQVLSIDPTSGVPTIGVGGIARTDLLFADASVAVGDTVIVIDNVCLGPIFSTQLPAVGVVATVLTNSSMIAVTTAIGVIQCGFQSTYTPTAGDAVYISWLGSLPVVIGKQGKTGTPPAPVVVAPPATKPPPPTAATTGTTTFPASSSGTYRLTDGWRTDANGNVIQGTSGSYPGLNQGAWFYGRRPNATLNGATVLSASIHLTRVNGGTFAAQGVNLQAVTNNVQPAGALTFTGAVVVANLAVGQSADVPLPASFVQAIVNAGGSIGIQAAGGSPYARLNGFSNDSQAGALTITWRK